MSLGDAAASSSTGTSTTTWDACVGPAKWLSEPLQRILAYPHPLPVQQAVIPTITRALMSGVPNDVSLTAPTGSGKTLCYLVPLLRLLTETKKGVDDNALRCLILVPTPSLGQQVHRELQRLTRPTSIRVACICTEVSPEGNAAEADAAEASLLIRRVVLPRQPALASTKADGAYFSKGGLFGEEKVGENGDQESDAESSGEDAVDDDDATSYEDEVGRTYGGGSPSSHVRGRDRVTVRYFSNADVIVATPQRLLHHLDHTRGLRLADLRLFVIDEADQILVGNFASQVQKVNARYEYEIQEQQQEQQRRQQRASELLASRLTSTSSSLLRLHGGHGSIRTSALHKVLCSATLSTRIARISQVKLRNCSYYVLDSNGKERQEEVTVATATTQNKKDNAAAMTVRTQFALPPTLQEHVIFVEDAYRPAVLLKLVHDLRERIATVQAHSRAKAARRAATDDSNRDADNNDNTSEVEEDKQSATAASIDYPNAEDKAGTGILVFCATAEEARVMGHFLAAAGITSVVEFTTLASEAERRRALLQRPAVADDADTAGDDGDGSAAEVSCVVASDALMRGIDVPNVGHVIMYHPPEAVSQYVHRAGRTARAMRPGHVHLLLSKNGPSGTLEDGEVALYKRLSQSLSRTLPVSYERLFFRFAESPLRRAAAAAAAAESTTTTTLTPGTNTSHLASSPKTARTPGSAEWWVEQAEKFLIQSQHRLQRRWASVLESAAAVAAANAKKTAAVAVLPAAAAVVGANNEQRKTSALTPSSASDSATQASSLSSPRKRARADAIKTTADQ
ncbi:putative ATP-dependent RNA helicase [Leptomonas pyrrhocoris]|uniref:ATP-dependent RNA helicase n=1 Tax=Leptomonas pyrrhocoris TaxID=157538 RepID=A0A0M9FSZ0_LEPPY|nr:putative ATP-dependent RNA helicase [Leptomonas pyrrhocoris]KPA75309.1 putative ATP-dependent RNA helicase [Leptomonas pyrrhocoris]|eukprot:XP_015653748.1 putative ATP-dependent RNA helicase [Leptomonas pyrrhocoris]